MTSEKDVWTIVDYLAKIADVKYVENCGSLTIKPKRKTVIYGVFSDGTLSVHIRRNSFYDQVVIESSERWCIVVLEPYSDSPKEFRFPLCDVRFNSDGLVEVRFYFSNS